jgi:hypothetical protein
MLPVMLTHPAHAHVRGEQRERVIPTEATRLFLAHGLCAPGRAVEGPWQLCSPAEVDGTKL